MTNQSFQSVGTNSDSNPSLIRKTWQSNIQIHESGLRAAQKAALYACFSYENDFSFDPIIVCMPTGTGKTGVIGSLIFRGFDRKTLIVVPSDALRTQIANDIFDIRKYIQWSIVDTTALEPIIYMMTGGFNSAEDLLKIENAQVVVTTAQSLMTIENSLLDDFYKIFGRIIFDESHHVEADGWDKIRDFAKKNKFKIYQFTATPYRLDGKKIEGRLAFRYSLQQAHKDGLFANIELVAIEEYYEEKSDLVIAQKAILTLEEDLNNEFEHILMVRASTISHAKKLKKIYKSITNRRVECIYSEMKTKDKDTILDDLKNLLIPVIVCVDMLGEGFDLPNLKICALHGHRKSLPIFFQLIGRFTRVSNKAHLGTAKIVANIVDENIIGLFDDLFKVDSDWNSILHGLNESKVQNEFSGDEIAAHISNKELKSIIERNNLLIKCSAQAFNYTKSINELLSSKKIKEFLNSNFDQYILEVIDDKDFIILLTQQKSRVSWSSESELTDTFWNICLFYKNEDCLFIYGDDRSIVNKIAQLSEFVQINGNSIFRVLSDLDLAVYANLGVLNNNVNANFIMYTGMDIIRYLSDIDRNNIYPSNIFGHGYVNGKKTSIGCSRKGVFWSMRSVKIIEWMDWCSESMKKITDESIDINKLTQGMMKCNDIESFDGLEVIDITPYKLFKKHNDSIQINICKIYDGRTYKLAIDYYDVKFLEFVNNTVFFNLIIAIHNYSEEFNIKCSWSFSTGFIILDSSSLASFKVDFGVRMSFLEELDLSLWTTDFSFIMLNDKVLFKPNLDFNLDESKVIAVDWSGIRTNVESWDYGSNPDSVQGKIIELIKPKNPKILFFDDGAGEFADLIEFQVDVAKNNLEITLYHCKYAKQNAGGSTIESITELVQQSISSMLKLSSLQKSLLTLKSRENRASRQGKTKFVDGIGNMSDLDAIIKMLKKFNVNLKVCLVQPSLSKSVLNDRVRANLSNVASILKKTVGAETYFFISD